AEEISGYSEEEVKGNDKIWELLYPEKAYREKVFQKVRDIIQNDETVEGYETIITDKDGKKKYIEWNSSSLKDKDGKIIGSVAIGRDVTNIKKMRKKEQEMKKLIVKRERVYHLGEMAAGVAHEINNPLTNVLTTAQLLLEEDIDKKYRDDIEIIRQNTERIAATVRGFLGFTKDRDFNFSFVDVNKLLDKTVKLVDKERRDDIEILKKYDRNMSDIKTSRFHLEEVFTNLIKNAIESMENSSQKILTLKTEEKEEYIKVIVKDTGEGIKEENLGKLFEPYYTTKGKKGTGLGLPSCKDIMDKLDGDIQAKSAGKKKGAEFILKIPKIKKDKK
ncbi:MAG: two-component system sensor histidine kinase NtrB, partial [Elusimicrobiota bacterium]